MLIILEGCDKSGKSTLVNALQKKLNAVVIRKSYIEQLYPINWQEAQMHDWETLLDRVIASNPDTMFIADRSFITQTVFQLHEHDCEGQITDEQFNKFLTYCHVVNSMKSLTVICQSPYFEVEGFIRDVNHFNGLRTTYVALPIEHINNVIVLDQCNKMLYDRVYDVIHAFEELNDMQFDESTNTFTYTK
jgi:hypothetical protein